MDKKIKKIQKETKHVSKDLSALLREDKKRDKVCALGKRVKSSHASKKR